MDIAIALIYVCLFIGMYFEVILFISFLEERPKKKFPEPLQNHPTVSILVPCYNEERTIAATLDSLLGLHYPADKLSIVVIDDGSRDHTAEIARGYAAKHPQISYLHKENGGKYTALNLGIDSSTGEFIGCLDADSFVAPDALEESMKCFARDPKVAAVAPIMSVLNPHNAVELMQSVEYTFGAFYKKMFDNLSAISVLPGPFSIYRRSVFDTVGKFKHAHQTEDMELTYRIQRHGLKLVNAHTAHVYTTVPKTVWGLIKQRTRWSQGFLQNTYDYRDMLFNAKYGNFGMFALPFGYLGFMAGLYTSAFAVITTLYRLIEKIYLWHQTQIPLHFPSFHWSWFYIDTSPLSLMIPLMLMLTLLAVFLGQNLTKNPPKLLAYPAFFLLWGFVAPIWLYRAAIGAVRSRDAKWR